MGAVERENARRSVTVHLFWRRVYVVSVIERVQAFRRCRSPIASSTAANSASTGRLGSFETAAPTRLPTPRPTIKAVTTTVTASMVIP
jgi:hypothetical protein